MFSHILWPAAHRPCYIEAPGIPPLKVLGALALTNESLVRRILIPVSWCLDIPHSPLCLPSLFLVLCSISALIRLSSGRESWGRHAVLKVGLFLQLVKGLLSHWDAGGRGCCCVCVCTLACLLLRVFVHHWLQYCAFLYCVVRCVPLAMWPILAHYERIILHIQICSALIDLLRFQSNNFSR